MYRTRDMVWYVCFQGKGLSKAGTMDVSMKLKERKEGGRE